MTRAQGPTEDSMSSSSRVELKVRAIKKPLWLSGSGRQATTGKLVEKEGMTWNDEGMMRSEEEGSQRA